MKGSATVLGTQRYQERQERAGIPPSGYRKLGRTGWTTSVLGFGCYRITENVPGHLHSLELALTEGCNLIDTSTNYGDGSSELCVGHAITNLFGSSKIQRDEVILISKVGYVQGTNLKDAKAREAQGHPYPEMVKYADGCWHCLHPDFISDQLAKSLDRLSQRQLDVYLLHNPEYFLSDALNRTPNASLSELRSEFYRRVRSAFEQLETEVSQGKIQAYGVSSNTFGMPADAFEATSLEKMWEIAESIAKEKYGDPTQHHFSVVQFPMNLFEAGPVLERNQGEALTKTALDFAAEKNLGVLINRPINAIVGNEMVRLADFAIEPESLSLEEAGAKVLELEEEFISSLAPVIKTQEGSSPANAFFRWGVALSRPEIKDVPIEQWSHIENDVILDQVTTIVSALNRHFSQSPGIWEAWRDRYLPQLKKLIRIIKQDAATRSEGKRKQISTRLNAFLPEALKNEPLSRRAMGVLTNTRGVSCVLNGMREMRYVQDSLTLLSWPPFLISNELYKGFSQAKGAWQV